MWTKLGLKRKISSAVISLRLHDMTVFSPLHSLDSYLEATASRWAGMPEKIALKDGNQALRFSELEARANHMARRLVDNGVGVGDFVGYLGPTGFPFVVTCWACLKAGMTFMPISPKFPDKSVADVLRTAKAKVFVSERALSVETGEFCQIGLPNEIQDTQPYSVANIPATVLAVASTTSGSTGTPKISGETRETIATVALQYLEMTGMGDHSCFGHCGTGAIPWMMAALYAGACVTCYDPTSGSAQTLFDWLSTGEVTHWHSYPALYRTLSEVDGELSDLGTLVLCGEPIFRHDFQLFERLTQPGATLLNIYAHQEYSLGACFEIRNGEHLAFDKIPVGRVIGENDLQILDEDGQPVGVRDIGEIVHRSLRVPEGYVGNPERSAQVFSTDEDGIHSFATGDLGYFDKDGLLHFVGRKDDRVKIRNFNLYPTDIEQEIKPHPKVNAVAVTVKYCARKLPRLACFYEGAVAPADLKQWLSERIPAFMMPQFFVPVDVLPRTATGKLQRNRLELPKNFSEAERVPARSPLEESLTEIWQDILGHKDFGVADNFFDVGGDSLRAMELLMLMNKRFGRLLTLDQVIVSGASIQGVAELVETHTERSQLRQLKPGKSETHIVVGHVYGGGVTDYLEFVRAIGDGFQVSGICADYSQRTRSYPIPQKAKEAVSHVPCDPATVMMGYSYGARIAFEIAQLLGTGGRIVLVDPIGPFSNRLQHWLKDAANRLVTPEDELGLERSYLGDFTYRPKPLKTAGALLVTCETSHKKDIKGWTAALDGPVDVFEVPGNHWDILRGSNAIEIANKVQDWLVGKPEERSRT